MNVAWANWCALVTLLVVPGVSVGATHADIEESATFGAKPGSASAFLRIISSADLSAMRPALQLFAELRESVGVRYDQASSNTVHTLATAAGRPVEGASYDLAISSAMDLQIKLANDGAARRFQSSRTLALPAAMRWRDRVFGFTEEPAAIVYNANVVPGGVIPASRFELLEYLRRHRSTLHGRVITYDVERSGLGYLLATQDSLRSDTYWRLMEVFGGLGARLSCCTATMLEQLSTGEAAIAYNAIGSYAYERAGKDSALRLLLPDDYVLIMTRSAVILRDAKEPELAGSFVDFLLSPRGRDALNASFGLARTRALMEERSGQTIRLDPALLVYLDAMKRRAFLDEWSSAIAPRPQL